MNWLDTIKSLTLKDWGEGVLFVMLMTSVVILLVVLAASQDAL